jgi:hypothetical protein
MRSLIQPWPPKDGDEIRFTAGMLSITVFFAGSAAWSYKWPPGLQSSWTLFAMMTVIAIPLDVWWLLRTPGWRKLGAIPMLFFAMVSFAMLADVYASDWAHRHR